MLKHAGALHSMPYLVALEMNSMFALSVLSCVGLMCCGLGRVISCLYQGWAYRVP